MSQNKCQEIREEYLQVVSEKCENSRFSDGLNGHSGIRGFPGGPVVKNRPCNIQATVSSTPGWGTEIPRGMGQQSPRVAAPEPACATVRPDSHISKYFLKVLRNKRKIGHLQAQI